MRASICIISIYLIHLSVSAKVYHKQCPHDCITFFDGCNTCQCDLGGYIKSCTQKFCASKGRQQCKACRNVACTTDLCRDGKPRRLIDGKCCACSSVQAPSPPPDCPIGCQIWFDGCNHCSCKNGEIGACTRKACSNIVTSQPYCKTWLKCQGAFCTKDICSDGKARRLIAGDCCACPDKATEDKPSTIDVHTRDEIVVRMKKHQQKLVKKMTNSKIQYIKQIVNITMLGQKYYDIPTIDITDEIEAELSSQPTKLKKHKTRAQLMQLVMDQVRLLHNSETLRVRIEDKLGFGKTIQRRKIEIIATNTSIDLAGFNKSYEYGLYTPLSETGDRVTYKFTGGVHRDKIVFKKLREVSDEVDEFEITEYKNSIPVATKKLKTEDIHHFHPNPDKLFVFLMGSVVTDGIQDIATCDSVRALYQNHSCCDTTRTTNMIQLCTKGSQWDTEQFNCKFTEDPSFCGNGTKWNSVKELCEIG